MLKSLFGELGLVGQAQPEDFRQPGDFAATSVMESHTSEHTERGEWVDHHVHDLFVTGAPAQAIREHLSSTWGMAGDGARHITLYDPVKIWGGTVIKTLSDACAQPIERLNLRNQATLATLATIERTVLPRRIDETLKVYHAELRAEVPHSAAIPMALMENSHLTAIIIGPMHATAVAAMLDMLLSATRNIHWRCPHLLFMLPVGAEWLPAMVNSVAWPPNIQVTTALEPLTSASAVWNILIAHWNRHFPPGSSPTLGMSPETAVTNLATALPSPVGSNGSGHLPTPEIRPEQDRFIPEKHTVKRLIAELIRLDGVLATALIQNTQGTVLSADSRVPMDIESLCTSAMMLLSAHNRTAQQISRLAPPIDTLTLQAGSRQLLIQPWPLHSRWFWLLVIDPYRINAREVKNRLSARLSAPRAR